MTSAGFRFHQPDVRTSWVLHRAGASTVAIERIVSGTCTKAMLWMAPAGFITDGASFPGWLRYLPTLVALIAIKVGINDIFACFIAIVLQWCVGAAFNDDYIRAAVLHDAAYTDGERSRIECDRMFREAMLADGTFVVRAWVMWLGVRLGGVYAWWQHRRKECRVN